VLKKFTRTKKDCANGFVVAEFSETASVGLKAEGVTYFPARLPAVARSRRFGAPSFARYVWRGKIADASSGKKGILPEKDAFRQLRSLWAFVSRNTS
jgi:hypothetical protein